MTRSWGETVYALEKFTMLKDSKVWKRIRVFNEFLSFTMMQAIVRSRPKRRRDEKRLHSEERKKILETRTFHYRPMRNFVGEQSEKSGANTDWVAC